MIVYFICAIIFTQKSTEASEEKSLSKGVLLKRQLVMYAGVLAGYLALYLLLSLIFLVNTGFGARLLILVLGVNIFLPFIVIACLNPANVKKAIGNVSETDRFMMKKGRSHTLSEAQKKPEFWLVIITFMITVGICRMMEDNAQIVAAMNKDAYGYSQTFNLLEVFGCFGTAIFLYLFRLYISPYAVLTCMSFLLLTSQILMFFISLSTLALFNAVCIAGFVQGGSFVLIGIISHESYGTPNVAKILGFFMTAGAIGILIFDELILDQFYSFFASSSDFSNQKSYGKWNKHIFIIAVLSSVVALITATGSYMKTRQKDSS